MIPNHEPREDSPGYRIGVASRLCGIAAHTLRKWEERYRVVSPSRTPAGERTYSEAQIRYLARLKALVDAGMDISDLVGLDEPALEAVESSLLSPDRAPGSVVVSPRVGVIGAHMPEYLRQHAGALNRLEIAWVVPTTDDVDAGAGETDILIIEEESVGRTTAERVRALQDTTGARSAVVVYDFAPRWALDGLRSLQVTAVRTPVEPADLQRLALGIWHDVADPPRIVADSPDGTRTTPPRFSDEALMRISAMSTPIRCECPQHIADLLMSVTSFEKYSARCEVEQPQDAVEHRYLRATAACARMLFEQALLRIARTEGIDIDTATGDAQDSG